MDLAAQRKTIYYLNVHLLSKFYQILSQITDTFVAAIFSSTNHVFLCILQVSIGSSFTYEPLESIMSGINSLSSRSTVIDQNHLP